MSHKYDVRFSPLENLVLTAIGKKAVSISDITKGIYEDPTLDRNNVVAGAIRRINRKCDLLEMNWFIDGIGAGRAGRQVWIETR